ncbi:uncharacterized protein PRCAT00003527001 [Priceomyces carsonii]|uniref:uncharacterized protein n=1 Tax=Priceomyces carsonii TaxID=28549 RepID=UPI002EDAB252|nr:unnamed protein product [Priceomyces carsonii]
MLSTRYYVPEPLPQNDRNNHMQGTIKSKDVTERRDVDIEYLVDRLLNFHERHQGPSRIIVTVAGVPGSGKSTVTKKVCDELNKKLGAAFVVVLPQDGFHYYRKELMNTADPEESMRRRGAPFTFNNEKLLAMVQRVKFRGNSTILAPDFSHQLKDPTENSIIITPQTRIVLVEGNYVHLNADSWKEISALADDKWTVLADLDMIKERLIKRHVEAGICANEKESEARVEKNDLVNAKYIIDHSVSPNIVIMNLT